MNGIRSCALLVAVVSLIAAGCGDEVRHAPPTAESLQQWEGVGIWRHDGDSMPLEAVTGPALDTAPDRVLVGNLVWSIDGVEELRKGLAGAWPDVDDRWIAVRVRIERDSPSVDSAVPPPPRSVLLRQALVLVDERGGRHAANLVHDRLFPSIDRPLAIPETGLVVPVVFSVGRNVEPAALEIHDPLGSGLLRWKPVPGPGSWQPVRTRAILLDEAERALWEVLLVQSRRDRDTGAPGPGPTGMRFMVQVRNVTSEPARMPDPAAARLYLGSGRTIASVSLGGSRTVAPGHATLLVPEFLGVPRRESLQLVLDFGGRVLVLDAAPGFLPERAVPLGEPLLSEGVRVTVLGVRRLPDGTWAVRLGLTNNGNSAIPLTGLTVTGILADGVTTTPAVVRDAPTMLHSGFEERRWIEFSAQPASVAIQVPGRPPIRVPLP